jgi:D-glycero-alpha-D-manno-heptose-7-phosphate kinase
VIVKAIAPARILDFGGWTDTWFAKRGRVLNFAVDLYSKVIIKTRERPGASLVAQDYGEAVEISEDNPVLYDGKHDLLKAALNVTRVDGVDISVYSDVPPGCGTGSSAALSVAMIGALAVLADLHLTPHEVATLAHKLETEELGIQSGVQDQIAAATGGIGFHVIDPYPYVSTSPIRLPEQTLLELESRLMLVYTGESHLSGEVHKGVISDYEAGRPSTLKAIETLRNTPVWAKSALMRGDFVELAEIMNINTAAQRDLHAGISTERIDELELVAKRAGAIGFKINGAGGGGSVTLLCGCDNTREVESAVKAAGFRVLPCHLDARGLRVWITERDGRGRMAFRRSRKEFRDFEVEIADRVDSLPSRL